MKVVWIFFKLFEVELLLDLIILILGSICLMERKLRWVREFCLIVFNVVLFIVVKW